MGLQWDFAHLLTGAGFPNHPQCVYPRIMISHALADVAQIHVPTRHFREALLSLNRESPKFYLPERHQTMAIYGNQNNINNSKSSKMSVIKMSNQNALARLNDLGPTWSRSA